MGETLQKNLIFKWLRHFKPVYNYIKVNATWLYHVLTLFYGFIPG